MKFILPKKIIDSNLNQSFRVNEQDGSNYTIQITSDDTDSIIDSSQKLTTLGKKYLIRIGVLEPYKHISYKPISFINNVNNAFYKFVNFRLVIDRGPDMSLITFEDYEQLQYTSKDNIPENAFASIYSTITYTKFEYRNCEPGDNLHYNNSVAKYAYFTGFVKPRNNIKVVLFNDKFIKLNNHAGYFDINGIRVYILTRYTIYGVVDSFNTFKYNNLTITEIDRVTLNTIFAIFTKYNFTPIITESSICGGDENAFIFIGKIASTPFDKYLEL